jgi:hypothetical protein
MQYSGVAINLCLRESNNPQLESISTDRLANPFRCEHLIIRLAEEAVPLIQRDI